MFLFLENEYVDTDQSERQSERRHKLRQVLCTNSMRKHRHCTVTNYIEATANQRSYRRALCIGL